jgi:hypothetical protein
MSKHQLIISALNHAAAIKNAQLHKASFSYSREGRKRQWTAAKPQH